MRTLLKTVFLGLLLSLSFVDAKDKLPLGSEVKEYDKIFEKIAEKRSGADIKVINELENPFIITHTEQTNNDSNTTSQAPEYILEATFDQKAKINGSWYKKNETIGLFKVVKIRYDRVILQNEIEKKELVIRTKDESNIKIFTK